MTTATDDLGKLIGNTGSPTNLRVALRGSFSARRGEFVRVLHSARGHRRRGAMVCPGGRLPGQGSRTRRAEPGGVPRGVALRRVPACQVTPDELAGEIHGL